MYTIVDDSIECYFNNFNLCSMDRIKTDLMRNEYGKTILD